MERPKKRSVYNFVLGLTLGGLILSCTNIAGNIAFDLQERAVLEDISSDQYELQELINACTGEGFYNHYSQELDKLEARRNSGKINAITYQTLLDYINSEQFKNEYMQANYKDVYENQIVPLREEIVKYKGEVAEIEEHITFINTIGLAGATVAAYSSAMLLQIKEEKELEKSR